MKYIMFRRDMSHGPVFVPIIFPTSLVHADVAQALTGAFNGSLHGYSVDSAGEISLMDGDDTAIRCHGSSETLNTAADPERDTQIIRFNDYGGGLAF